MNQEEIRQRLWQVVKDAHISQASLAKRCGISGPYFNRILKGHCAISRNIINKITKNTGLSEAWLLNGEGSPELCLENNGPKPADHAAETACDTMQETAEIDILKTQTVALQTALTVIHKMQQELEESRRQINDLIELVKQQSRNNRDL